MEAEAALASLREVSKHVESATIFGADGRVIGSTLSPDAAKRSAERAAEILSSLDAPAAQVEAATREGSVFLVREDDVAIVATTSADPPIGLVMYDLRTCVRSLAPEKEPA